MRIFAVDSERAFMSVHVEGALQANKNLLCQLNVRKMAGNGTCCASVAPVPSPAPSPCSLMLSLTRTHLINHARMTTTTTMLTSVCVCVCVCYVVFALMTTTCPQTTVTDADDYGAPAGADNDLC